MKTFDPTLPQKSYKTGEELLVQSRNRKTGDFETVVGKVLSNDGLSSDGMPYIELEASGTVKRYATGIVR